MPMVRRHILVSTHSRLKAAGYINKAKTATEAVSTHSRPKAAGFQRRIQPEPSPCFNTQPPEGGWLLFFFGLIRMGSFNTQPPEGGWYRKRRTFHLHNGFNTQPPEGGWVGLATMRWRISCFNTQPPEGGWSLSQKPCSIKFRGPDFAKLSRKARTRV